jgi:glycosyltransferase involved in cell wall biosynthesis
MRNADKRTSLPKHNLEPAVRPASLSIFTIFFHPATCVTAKGGAEKRLIETLRIICKRKDTKIAVLESSPSLLNESGILCTKYVVGSSLHGKGWLSTYLEWILWATKACFRCPPIIRREKPNVIFIPNNTLPNALAGFITGLTSHLPTCIVVHHIDTPFAKAGGKGDSLYDSYRSIGYSRSVSLAKTLGFQITLPLLRKARTILAVSNSTATALASRAISGERIHISGNAIDFNQISGVRPSGSSKAFDGVFVGRIAKEKGIFELLEAWRIVVDDKKKAKLLIIGSGLELASLRKAIASAGLGENVVVRAHCNDHTLCSLLKASKVFLFPSYLEGWGLAPAEALACGIPVVAYAIPALREVFGKCGSVFLVPVGRVDRMAQTVLKVLDLESKELCETSTSFAKGFEWASVASADLDAITAAATEKR